MKTLRLLTGAALLSLATSAASAKDDPDQMRPDRTTGGQIGTGAGLVIGGLPGAATGALIGHGTDRVLTRFANDITGPAWTRVEKKWGSKAANLGNPRKWRW